MTHPFRFCLFPLFSSAIGSSNQNSYLHVKNLYSPLSIGDWIMLVAVSHIRSKPFNYNPRGFKIKYRIYKKHTETTLKKAWNLPPKLHHL